MQFPVVVQAESKWVVWDSMRAHISKQVKENCQSRGISMYVVPGGLTPHLQAGDIGVYGVFKNNLYRHVDDWKSSDSFELTRFGNPKPPDTGCDVV
jgi:DDE superfamily endonuclease